MRVKREAGVERRSKDWLVDLKRSKRLSARTASVTSKFGSAARISACVRLDEHKAQTVDANNSASSILEWHDAPGEIRLFKKSISIDEDVVTIRVERGILFCCHIAGLP